jgi:16S rRNA (guanine527-N7)-methyltransferase
MARSMARNITQDVAASLAADRAEALALLPVSREIGERLDRFVALLLERQAVMNLVAPSTLPQIWTRHVADSLQLLSLAPRAKRWIDLGSGAGFPGLVIAAALVGEDDVAVHLVESIGKKAAFLREAAHAIDAPVTVHAERIENFAHSFDESVNVVTARALAPMDKLLGLAHPLLKTGAQGLFHKGQDVDAELTLASKYWNISADLIPSKTNPRSRIVRIHSLSPKPARRKF